MNGVSALWRTRLQDVCCCQVVLEPPHIDRDIQAPCITCIITTKSALSHQEGLLRMQIYQARICSKGITFWKIQAVLHPAYAHDVLAIWII